MKIALTSIFVEDPVKAHRFYTEVLGFASRVFVPEANLAIVASPEDPGGAGLLLEPSDNPAARQFHQAMHAQGMPAIIFGTSDVQKEYERLSQRGVSFHQPPTQTEWGIQAVLDDTCGNLVAISQVTQ